MSQEEPLPRWAASLTPSQYEGMKKHQAEMAEYYRQHCRCPECGSTGIESTTMGPMYFGAYEDRTNRATCGCGWRGTPHDLVPEVENVDES